MSARAVSAGAGLTDAMTAAQSVGSRSHLIGALDTMRFLAKSGRVPWIVHWAVSALQIKPILAADGEQARGIARVRTMSRAQDWLLRYLEERVRPGAPLHVAVMHFGALDQAEELARREESFLRLARLGIYANPNSAFRRLLLAAGIDFEALERLVGQLGLEEAVSRL